MTEKSKERDTHTVASIGKHEFHRTKAGLVCDLVDSGGRPEGSELTFRGEKLQNP